MNNNNDSPKKTIRAAKKAGKAAKKSGQAIKTVSKWIAGAGCLASVIIFFFFIFLFIIIAAAGALVAGKEGATANTTVTVQGYNNSVVKACETHGIPEYSNFVLAILWTYSDICGENKTLDVMGAGDKKLNTKSKHEKGAIIDMDYSIDVAAAELAKLIREYGLSSPEAVSSNGELVLAFIAQSYHFDTAAKERGYYNFAKKNGYTVSGAQTYLDSNLKSGIGIKTLDARFGERVISHMQELDAKDSGASSGANGTPGTGHCPTEWAGQYVYPLTKEYRYVSSHALKRRWCHTHGWETHGGTDIPAPGGTPIYAVADGTVIYTSFDAKGYGNYVKIQHANWTAIYAHMSVKLAVPGKVKRGDLIGKVGTTGSSTGNHLHFELRLPSGTKIDPETIFTSFY